MCLSRGRRAETAPGFLDVAVALQGFVRAWNSSGCRARMKFSGTGLAVMCFWRMLLLLMCQSPFSGGKRGRIPSDVTFMSPTRLLLGKPDSLGSVAE